MPRAISSLLLLLILILGTLAGCDGVSSDDPLADEQATFTLLLTDAPFPFDLVDEVNVTIDRVDLISDDEEVLTLTTAEQRFNLLDLRDGVTATLATEELPVGTYSQIRLYVTEASVLLTDDRLFDLTVPSERIRVLLNGLVIDEDVDTELTLDFDVSESFVVQGNPETPAGIRGFIFKPVVKPLNLVTTPDEDDIE
jgi:hypothetical protein